MKKLLSALLCLCMLCAVVPEMAYTAGEYTATGAGLFGDITVTVTFDAEKIVSVVVNSHSETAGISDPALEQIPAAIVANQSLAVDVVAGATFTSKGIIEAVANAVTAANGDFFHQEYPASGTSIMMCFTVGHIAGTNAAECD